SLVRTNAGPLPGLTCWNSTICHRCPSSLRTRPFLKSAVDAIFGTPYTKSSAGGRVELPRAWSLIRPSENAERLGGCRQGPSAAVGDGHSVLDSDPTESRKIDPGFDGDHI